jgi:hypothetical protein
MRSQILDAIYNKLDSIDDIAEVYKYNKGQFDNYPVAVILGTENEKERMSVKTILKHYKFKIQVIQEVNEESRGQEAGENLLNSLSGQIDDAFDNDDTLGGVCDDVLVASSFIWEDRELLMRVLEMEIICKKLIQIT